MRVTCADRFPLDWTRNRPHVHPGGKVETRVIEGRAREYALSLLPDHIRAKKEAHPVEELRDFPYDCESRDICRDSKVFGCDGAWWHEGQIW